MTLTISRLEAKLRHCERAEVNNTNPQVDSLNGQNAPHHIKELSEEVVRLRDKIAHHNSESLAMKSRLTAAIDRSKLLEEELQVAKISSNTNGMISESLEQGYGMTVPGRRRGKLGAKSSGSIRTAMLLNSSRGHRTEQIGEVVDQIDSFAASTGM